MIVVTASFLKLQRVMKLTYHFLWLFEDDTTPTMVKRQRALKKSDVCRFLQKYGIGQSHQVGRTEDSDYNWYTTKCLPEIQQEGNVRGLMLHHNKASSHTAG